MLRTWLAYVHARAGYQSLNSLRRFSPRERTKMVAFVQRRHWVSLSIVSAMTGAGIGAWIILIAVLWLRFVGPVMGFGAWFVHEPARASGLCVLLLAMLAVGPVAGLLVRDRWLAWAMSKHASDAKCHDCEYSFAGVPIEEQRITCPECGQCAVVVKARGVIPERMMG